MSFVGSELECEFFDLLDVHDVVELDEVEILFSTDFDSKLNVLSHPFYRIGTF